MDVRRLKLKKIFGGGLKAFFKKVPRKRVILFSAGIILLGVFLGILYYFRTEIFVIIPGYYKNYEYNSFTSKKNDLIEENAELLLVNDGLNAENAELGATVEDFDQKIENNTKILDNLEKINGNVDDILEFDGKFLKMRLPYVVERYVELSDELDQVRKVLIAKSLEIVEARIGIDTFNRTRAEFDACLVGINWSDSDQNIANYIEDCNKKISIMDEQLLELEEKYDINLEGLNRYLTLLKEQWESSVLYYRAIAKKDYDGANSHDAVFVQKKREISELDPEIFNEFNVLVINILVEEFGDLSMEEQEKEKACDHWYDNNIGR